MAQSSKTLRQFYASYVCGQGGVGDDRIRAAFETIPRERFSGKGPWRIFTAGGYIDTPSNDLCFLYQDHLVAIEEDRGANNGQPSLHARAINAVMPKAGDRVLHVGAGRGYYSAILAHLVGPAGHVEAREINQVTADRARLCLVDFSNIEVLTRSGTEPGLPISDIVYVNAGAPRVMTPWLDSLADGGRLIFPLTSGDHMGGMLLVTRRKDRFEARFVCRAAFIPCIGAEDPGASERLKQAYAAGGFEGIRSLVQGPEKPDSTCWLAGDGWWLSTRALADAGGPA